MSGRGGDRTASAGRRTFVIGCGAAMLGLGLDLPPAAAAERRIDALLGRMTTEEETGQLGCFSDEARPLGTPFNPAVGARRGEGGGHRVLMLKEAPGLFDDPFRSLDTAAERRAARRARTSPVACEVAAPSVLLLRNAADLLPLPRSGRRSALVGPLAADHRNLNGP